MSLVGEKCFRGNRLWFLGIAEASSSASSKLRFFLRRCVSSESDDPHGFINRSLAAPSSPSPEDAMRKLTSTRKEALSLYRLVWRTSRLFNWPSPQGILWRDLIRLSARKEFEAARFEKDPETIARLLIGGRDAVQMAIDKLIEKQQSLVGEKNLE